MRCNVVNLTSTAKDKAREHANAATIPIASTESAIHRRCYICIICCTSPGWGSPWHTPGHNEINCLGTALMIAFGADIYYITCGSS